MTEEGEQEGEGDELSGPARYQKAQKKMLEEDSIMDAKIANNIRIWAEKENEDETDLELEKVLSNNYKGFANMVSMWEMMYCDHLPGRSIDPTRIDF